ncbi:galactose ABC transporter substrate-binding protein [Deltaproteobacteria bacterium]|nr:galactose ABC transporter substrate-binding protein [Deltaproteobacteria bacterium]
MTIRKASLGLILALTLTFAWTAAASAAPKLGILIYRYEDAYVSTVRDALRKALDGKAEFTMQDGQGNQDTQNAQVDALIEQQVDGLIVNMVDTQAAGLVLDKAMAANIPVVFFNREPDLELLTEYDKAVFIGTNAADAGKMQGDIIKKIWADHPEYDLDKDGKFQYVMFKGDPDNPEAIARSEWSVKQAELNGVKMDQLGQTYVCNWDTALAQEAMAAALAAHEGRIELAIANNDAMAMGAIAALTKSGYNIAGGKKYIPVIGVDATDQAVDAINKGHMSGTVKQDGKAMAEAVAAVSLNLIAGQAPLDGTSHKFDESGLAVRIPYSPYTGAK